VGDGGQSNMRDKETAVRRMFIPCVRFRPGTSRGGTANSKSKLKAPDSGRTALQNSKDPAVFELIV
jgi:hypothetical protein